MEKIVYKHLSQREYDDGLETEGAEEICRLDHQPGFPVQQRVISKFVYIILLVSITANIHFAYAQYMIPWKLAERLPSKFAHLKYDVPIEIMAHSDFDSTNRTIQDEAWDDPELEPWSLFVAVDDDYSASMGLPSSQRWPWDAHKGAYIPISAHELHCVHVLRSVVNENHDGLSQDSQTWPYGHAMHCLNVLKDSVMCHADDTLMYTGRLHKNVFDDHPKAGVGMVKMCRNWGTLVSWARERSACYRPVRWFDREFNEIERYKFCPDGSTPWEQAQGN